MSDLPDPIVERIYIKHPKRRSPWHIEVRSVRTTFGFEHVSACGSFRGLEHDQANQLIRSYDQSSVEPEDSLLCHNCIRSVANPAVPR